MQKSSVEMTESGILIFTIQRASIRNAIDYDVMDQLQEALRVVRENHLCKALIITGEGNDAFCSGGDLSVFSNLHTKDQAFEMLTKMGNILYELLTLPVPTVALLNGIAIGGGIELATACDFRIARSETRFGFVQGRQAITTGWGGGSILFEKFPFSLASQLLYSAQTFSVEWGEEQKYIQKILSKSTYKDDALKYTEELISNCSRAVLSSYKEIVISKWKELHIKERMEKEIEQCSILWTSKEHIEAVTSFLNGKRKS